MCGKRQVCVEKGKCVWRKASVCGIRQVCVEKGNRVEKGNCVWKG